MHAPVSCSDLVLPEQAACMQEHATVCHQAPLLAALFEMQPCGTEAGEGEEDRKSVLPAQIVYNAAYGRYVLLFHADTPKFEFPAVGVAFAKDITGERLLH
jgi:hypothetical protein